MSTDCAREMPRYSYHKEVHALKIKSITILDNGDGVIFPEDEGFASFQVDKDYMNRYKPVAGGYYVADEDGDKSFSPSDTFEAGYTKMT